MKILDEELNRRRAVAKHAHEAGFATTATYAHERAEDYANALAAMRDLIRAAEKDEGVNTAIAQAKEYIECN